MRPPREAEGLSPVEQQRRKTLEAAAAERAVRRGQTARSAGAGAGGRADEQAVGLTALRQQETDVAACSLGEVVV